MAGGAGLVSQWWFTIDEFMDRAERVLSSEIARREDLATVGTTMKLIGSLSEGATSWRTERDHPPEAHIESAATRVRPLFLENDSVFHGKVTTAIGGLARGAPEEIKQVIKALKKAWRSDEEGYRWSFGVGGAGVAPEHGRLRTDRQIARDFLYGKLVHADPEARQRLRFVPEDEQLLAAVVWAADATRLTQATKKLIIDLRDGGYFTPRP
jgi:hypothetical protein